MKFNKYILILALFIILICSTSVISASEDFNENIVKSDADDLITNNQNEELILNSYENIDEQSANDLNEITVENNSKKDLDYDFTMDTENYLIGSEWDSIQLKLPKTVKNYTITLDDNETIFNSNHGGIGIAGENITFHTIYLKNLNILPGKHTFNLSYPGDDEYNSFSKAINFTCLFIEVSLTGEPFFPQLKFNFANNANGTVYVFVDNALFTNKTVSQLYDEANSQPRYEPMTTYTIYLEDTPYGNHTYKILYSNDERYVLDNAIEGKFNHKSYNNSTTTPDNDTNENTSQNITKNNSKTKKQKPKVIAKKKTFKAKTKIKRYTVTLKSVKKVKVYLKIAKKTYKATTNNKGKATFKITKLTKKGTYKAKIIFKGSKKYRSVNITVKLKIK